MKLNLPSTIKLPCNLDVPYTSIPLPTVKCFAIPAPPTTTSEPVSVLLESIVFCINTPDKLDVPVTES